MRAALIIVCAAAACGRPHSIAERSAQQELALPPTVSTPREPLGIGRAATAHEIARWDIDVRPDGRGLPPGRGTPDEGEQVYLMKCQACHGANGEGVRPAGSALISPPADSFNFAASMRRESQKTIGNYWPYATTLFDYVRRAMPFNAPGSLSDNEVYAVTAYLLWKNAIISQNSVMNGGSLPLVRMPARDRFVPDDRETSKRVR